MKPIFFTVCQEIYEFKKKYAPWQIPVLFVLDPALTRVLNNYNNYQIFDNEMGFR